MVLEKMSAATRTASGLARSRQTSRLDYLLAPWHVRAKANARRLRKSASMKSPGLLGGMGSCSAPAGGRLSGDGHRAVNAPAAAPCLGAASGLTKSGPPSGFKCSGPSSGTQKGKAASRLSLAQLVEQVVKIAL